MIGRQKSTRELGEHAIFGNEQAAELQAEVAALRVLVADLSVRVHAQFTTISAHAEIAREQVEFTREEARADLDRTRDLVIGLIEQTRADLGAERATHVAGSAPGASVAAFAERLDGIDARLTTVAAAVDRCFDRQRELADTMAAVLDTVLADRRSEPVVGLSLA